MTNTDKLIQELNAKEFLDEIQLKHFTKELNNLLEAIGEDKEECVDLIVAFFTTFRSLAMGYRSDILGNNPGLLEKITGENFLKIYGNITVTLDDWAKDHYYNTIDFESELMDHKISAYIVTLLKI